MKDYNKNEESSHLKHWHVNNLHGWAMLQKLPLNKFERIKDTCQFNEVFIKNNNEESDKFIFSKLIFKILKNYMNFIMIYHFYHKE